MKTFHHQPTFSGDLTGAILSDGTTVTGKINVHVQNRNSDESFRVENPARTKSYVGSYGTLVIDAAGNWTYTLDTANPAVSGLAEAATLTDTIQVRSSYNYRNTKGPSVVITITGAAA